MTIARRRSAVFAAGAALLGALALGAVVAHGSFSAFSKPRTVKVGNDPSGIASADFNRDGRPDLAVTDFAPPVSVTILRNRGRGRFRVSQTIPMPTQPDDIVVAPHINGDKDPDLVVGGFTNGVSTLRGTSGAHFATPKLIPDLHSPRQVAVGDFNHDGLTDVAADRQGTTDVAVYLATGNGAFAPPDVYPGGSGADISAIRVNGDRRPDLVVPNPSDGVVRVYPGRADGTFAAPIASPAGASPSIAASGDFNRDRKVDLAVANPDPNSEEGMGRMAILLGRGNGRFRPPRQFGVVPFVEGPPHVAAADFDRDGHQDLALSLEFDRKILLLKGKPRGRFGKPRPLKVGDRPEGLVATRLNRDRRPDIATAVALDNSAAAGHVSVLLKK
jgi:hypothetical protein